MPVLKTWSKDPRVKFWLQNHDAPEPEVDRSKLVGFFLPVLNNIKFAEGVYHSFVRSMPVGYPFAIIVMDGGSTDGTAEFFAANCETFSNTLTSKEIIPENITGLCKLTDNVAVRMFFGDYEGDEARFTREEDFGYIGYLHSDMEFRTEGWVGELVELCEQDDQVGIIGPRTEQNYDMPGRLKAGNVCPMIMPIRVLKDHYKHFGYYTDPEFFFKVGYDDWDLHLRNMIRLGYKSLIYRDVYVSHPMCGTGPGLFRADANRAVAFNHNRDYWCRKWGFESTEDPFTLLEGGRIKVERAV